MTTMAMVDATLARFDRKSPRDSYKQVCGELSVHMQHDIYALLPEKPSAWHQLHTLDLERSLLGTRGCMALLPIITVSTSLRKLTLRSCGLSDEFVAELCGILENHPALRSVDISNNELVTVHSASHIISTMRNNKNMVLFDVYNTHVGKNVADIIAGLGERNLHSVLHYYEDRYFAMKDLFSYLDADGAGWVLLKSLVLNCPFPVLQERFIERIAAKKPRRRSDNTVSINTFLQLVYMNYKTESEIGRMAEQTIDEPYVFTVANWKQLLYAVERYNSRTDVPRQVQLPEDLHRWRLRDYLMLRDDADAIVETAVQLIEHASMMGMDSGIISPTNAAAAAAEGSSAGPLLIPITVLLQAAKASLVTPPTAVKPVYQFFQDYDVTYVPTLLRNGSRTMSLGGMSALLGGMSSFSGGSALTGGGGGTEHDPTDPPHTFSLPASIVRMTVQLFNAEAAKLPSPKASAVPDTPRRRRDRAMERTAIPVRAFLNTEFVTDLEKVCPRLLADYYVRHALPIDEGTVTLQEMVNLLDEMYVQCRVDKVLSLAQIQAMSDPMRGGPTAGFLSAHLLERDEEDSFVEPFVESTGAYP